MNRPTLPKGVEPLNPLYAAVGVADLALEKVRAMGGMAVESASHLAEPETAANEVHKAVDGARHAPLRALNQTLDVVTRSQNRFDELAERGRRVISRTRSEAHIPSGPELLHQAEDTMAMGRDLAVRAAGDTRKVATSTLKQVRMETDHLVDDTRMAATATLKSVRAEADHMREVVTRRELPKRPHVPTTLRRRTEGQAAAAAAVGDGPVATTKPRPRRPAPGAGTTAAKAPTKTAAKPASKTAAPRPARKAPARKRTAAATKTAGDGAPAAEAPAAEGAE
ncbi:MAG TPA: hypothetical protein VES01_10170 [Dermatophilaceae bacterium]|nr:hypothetical protein [Dermatophilaceae bacterium]